MTGERIMTGEKIRTSDIGDTIACRKCGYTTITPAAKGPWLCVKCAEKMVLSNPIDTVGWRTCVVCKCHQKVSMSYATGIDPICRHCRTELAKEADPTGREAGEPGAKLDQGKVRLGLVLGGFANALREVGEVGTFGAAKYSDNGWKEVPRAAERYTDAMLRHWQKMAIGELVDPDSGLLHAAHMAWNALAVLEKALDPMPDSREVGSVLPGERAELPPLGRKDV